MRISILSIFILFIIVEGFAQTAPDKYWVQFTDKTNTPYSLTNPSEFLSSRAIQRRLAQNISYQQNDLPVDPAYIDSVAAMGVQVLNRSKWFNAITIYTTNFALLSQIQALSFVQGIQKVAQLTTQRFDEINLFQEKKDYRPTGMNSVFNYGYGENQIDMINGTLLHDNGFTGEGKVIAILDAGFRNVDTLPVFGPLWDNKQILGVRDFVTGDSTVFEDHIHGMNVFSIMGANLPGQLVGTAPGASYWLLRSEDGGSENMIEEDNWVTAAEFADSVGADIINSSLGYTTFDNSSVNHSYEDMDGNTARVTIGADIAASKGMLVVNSAGNSGNSPWHYIGAPADGDSVFSIGAVDEFGDYALFSSTGPTYDKRVKPNVVAQGNPTAVQSTSGSIAFGNGTSFSSPIIAGMAACLWQAHPSMTNMQLLESIQQSASQYMNPDSLLGYGIPNFAAASTILDNLELEINNYVKVSPNPFSDRFFLEMYHVDSQTISFELYDITGRLQQKKYSFDNYLNYRILEFSNLGHLPSGLYVLRIVVGNKVQQLKLIKG